MGLVTVVDTFEVPKFCLLKFIPETVYYPSWPKYFKQLSALISSLAKNIFKKKSIMRFSPQR